MYRQHGVPLQTETPTLWNPIIQTQNFITDLLQLFKMLTQELHRPLWLSDAEVHNALFQDLLDVMLLHKYFTALQTLVFFQSGGGGGHLIFYLCGSGKQGGPWEEGRESGAETGVEQGSTGGQGGTGLRKTERRGKMHCIQSDKRKVWLRSDVWWEGGEWMFPIKDIMAWTYVSALSRQCMMKVTVSSVCYL